MDIKNEIKARMIKAEDLLRLIKPGFRIFITSGPSVPALTLAAILESDDPRLQDLEIIQLVNYGPSMNPQNCVSDRKYRLKIFNSSRNICEGITGSRVDFVPANLVEIPYIFSSGAVGVDMAVIQTSPPDSRGFVNLGISNDVADIVIKSAPVLIAEINPNVPLTFGKTWVRLDRFTHIVESDIPLLTKEREPFDAVYEKIGWHISNLIEDGSTVVLHAGRLFDAAASHLMSKKNLGIITHIISDWAMDLVESGAIPPDRERFNGGQITTSYCLGTKKLYDYVGKNPVFEFHPFSVLADPFILRRARALTSIMNVKKIDAAGGSVIFHSGDSLLSGYESKLNFAVAASFSRGGKAIAALRSSSPEGESNIVISLRGEDPDRVRSTLGAARYVVTEYGTANLFGKSIRERVLAMIDIAHPLHRENLLAQAKDAGFAYPDQIYVGSYAANYPFSLETRKTFRDMLELRIRPIKPSDEDMMRRLFYEFSDETRYMRYFTNIASMPHKKMQEYVNIDYLNTLSLVAVLEKQGTEKIVAEARYAYTPECDAHETAFIVDEKFQGRGIASFMLDYLISIASERGCKRLTASILTQNRKMLRVFDRARIKPLEKIENGIVTKTIELQLDTK